MKFFTKISKLSKLLEQKNMRDPNIETGQLDLGARQGGWDLNTCKNLGHQYDTRHPLRLDRNLFAQPPELATDNLVSPELRD
ncbi:hypothetical protein YC2023_120877 [Brassica napus]